MTSHPYIRAKSNTRCSLLRAGVCGIAGWPSARSCLLRAGVSWLGSYASARTALRRTGVHSLPHTEVQRHRVRLTAQSR